MINIHNLSPARKYDFLFPATNLKSIFGYCREYTCVRYVLIWKLSEVTIKTCVLMVCGLATGTEDLRILFLNYFPRLYYAAYTDLQELLQKLRL